MKFDFDKTIETTYGHKIQIEVYKEGEELNLRSQVIGSIDDLVVIQAVQKHVTAEATNWEIANDWQIVECAPEPEYNFDYLQAKIDCLLAVKEQCERSSIATIARRLATES